MDGVFFAVFTVLAQGEFFFHFLLVALGIDHVSADATLEFCHVVFNLSHTWNLLELFTKNSFSTLR